MCIRILLWFGKLPQWNCHVNETIFEIGLRYQGWACDLHKCANKFCGKTNNPKARNTPDTRFVFMIISVLLSMLHLLSLYKSLIYPHLVYNLYNECSEDVTGKYRSAKYQWHTLGAIAPP